MLIISHPTGNQNFRNAAESIYKEKQLAQLFTTISWKSDHAYTKYLPNSIRSELLRREFKQIPSEKISTYPYRELTRQVLRKTPINFLTNTEKSPFSVDTIYQKFDKYVSNKLTLHANLKSVYCYEDGAFETFKKAKELGLQTIYELPIGYWRTAHQILGEEQTLQPEWAATIFSTKTSKKKTDRKEAELELTDKIIVPSQFVAETLKLSNIASSKINILPYGGPMPVEKINQTTNKRLKVLFVGGLSQRKGISYLFKAAEVLKDKISLTVIGGKLSQCNALDKALDKCRYIPHLSHAEVLQEMHQHDVLVFPSLFEGFGLVILEAMSQGIPVITTANSGPSDAIVDKKNAYIIPIRSHEAIAEKLEHLANNPSILHAMKEDALLTAKNSAWTTYQQKLTKIIIPA